MVLKRPGQPNTEAAEQEVPAGLTQRGMPGEGEGLSRQPKS